MHGTNRLRTFVHLSTSADRELQKHFPHLSSTTTTGRIFKTSDSKLLPSKEISSYHHHPHKDFSSYIGKLKVPTTSSIQTQWPWLSTPLPSSLAGLDLPSISSGLDDHVMDHRSIHRAIGPTPHQIKGLAPGLRKVLRSTAEEFKPFSNSTPYTLHEWQEDSPINMSSSINSLCHQHIDTVDHEHEQYFSSCNLSPIGPPSRAMHSHDPFNHGYDDSSYNYSTYNPNSYPSCNYNPSECFSPLTLTGLTPSISVSSIANINTNTNHNTVGSQLFHATSYREEFIQRGLFEVDGDCTRGRLLPLSMGLDCWTPLISPHCSPTFSCGTPLGSADESSFCHDYCRTDDECCFDILKEMGHRSSSPIDSEDVSFDDDSMGLTVPVCWMSPDCSDSCETAAHHLVTPTAL